MSIDPNAGRGVAHHSNPGIDFYLQNLRGALWQLESEISDQLETGGLLDVSDRQVSEIEQLPQIATLISQRVSRNRHVPFSPAS